MDVSTLDNSEVYISALDLVDDPLLLESTLGVTISDMQLEMYNGIVAEPVSMLAKKKRYEINLKLGLLPLVN